MDGGAWQATGHGITKSQTQLSDYLRGKISCMFMTLTTNTFSSLLFILQFCYHSFCHAENFEIYMYNFLEWNLSSFYFYDFWVCVLIKKAF